MSETVLGGDMRGARTIADDPEARARKYKPLSQIYGIGWQSDRTIASDGIGSSCGTPRFVLFEYLMDIARFECRNKRLGAPNKCNVVALR